MVLEIRHNHASGKQKTLNPRAKFDPGHLQPHKGIITTCNMFRHALRASFIYGTIPKALYFINQVLHIGLWVQIVLRDLCGLS